MINKVKGTYDILPEESRKWQFLEESLRDICKTYCYSEIRTPTIEYSEVFHRQNELSDMVTKETYNFRDLSGKSTTLRPEGTAGIIRSYVENKLYYNNDFFKVYYFSNNYRYERPQKGRYREFRQFGIEAIGKKSPALDAEVIMLSYDISQKLALSGIKIRINTLGGSETRLHYKEVLKEYFQNYRDSLCPDCQNRLDKNPLRILDCKIDNNSPFFLNAPKIIDFLSVEEKSYFDEVIKILKGSNIPFDIDYLLVRGLDYYGHTVFEIETADPSFGSQKTLCGGGRYMDLIAEFGGPKELSGIGVAFGMERLLMASPILNGISKGDLDIYVLTLLDNYYPVNDLVYLLRNSHLTVDTNYTISNFKTLLKNALLKEPKYIIIVGEDEVNGNYYSVKNTKTTSQVKIDKNHILAYLKENINA